MVSWPARLIQNVRTQKHLVHSRASIAPSVSLVSPWRRARCGISDRARPSSRGLLLPACRPTHAPWSKQPCCLLSGAVVRSRPRTIRSGSWPGSAARTGYAVSNLPGSVLCSLDVSASRSNSALEMDAPYGAPLNFSLYLFPFKELALHSARRKPRPPAPLVTAGNTIRLPFVVVCQSP